ncbi:MAG TPA: zinc dependent phospholipase C family protein [Gemmatimonadales bacterium]|nr:zinc dependent phospholipase C family protein [Gemmatimonadales bacterium]
MTLLAFALVVLVGLAWPEQALAWTPGTHVVLGERILSSLQLLVPSVADLLRAFPYDFLYGSIAADTTMAKKYAPADRHCHAWHVGREVYELAPTDALKAFGLGYLAHLAADVVAHNHYVPRQLVVTSSTRSMGHTYWESRVETVLGDAVPRAARELIGLDHRAADAHLERILSPTIFSVRTNRRLFKGMVRLADSRPWQVGMQVAHDQSRWDLPEELISRHLDRATNHIRSMLNDTTSQVLLSDPNGEAAILRSKQVRREAMRSSARRDRDWIAAVADQYFGLEGQGGLPMPATDVVVTSPLVAADAPIRRDD